MTALSDMGMTDIGMPPTEINPDIPILQLSQGHLQTLETCPRKFQYLYVDQIGAPQSSEEQARLLAGRRFHLLLQQHELGLPVEPLAAEHTPLDVWLDRFLKAEPAIVGGTPEAPQPLHRESEHPRSHRIDSFLLVAIYDLLVTYPDHAQILDWKTYPRPQNSQRLTQSWQTRLYLYLLAETSGYQPKQLSMTYWFFQTPDQDLNPGEEATPQLIQIPYSKALHRRTQKDLSQKLKDLKAKLTAYSEGQAFPQVPETSNLCPTCPFAVHCQRSQASKQPDWIELDFDQIPEVPIMAIAVPQE